MLYGFFYIYNCQRRDYIYTYYSIELISIAKILLQCDFFNFIIIIIAMILFKVYYLSRN